VVAIDPTGVLDVDGAKLFPLGVSNPPPLGGRTAQGQDAFTELASGGVSFMRIGRGDWSLAQIDAQLAEARQSLDAAHAHGLHCWLWLGETAVLSGPNASENEQLLRRIVGAVKTHPGLGAYKGIDEPHNPFRPRPVDPVGMKKAYDLVKQLDAGHPLVVTHEPISSAASLKPYAAACDITGADIFPVSYPPGTHAQTANRDVSVVGDITKKLKQVAGARPVWMTLQIAWNGVTPSKARPNLVPRFPTLLEERFMAYQAIANGARGLFFFGGHLTQVMRPVDAKTGWNWTFWELVLRPLLTELTSTAVRPALVAPAGPAVQASAGDVEVTTRRAAGMFYVIAVRRGGSTTRVTFSGLPAAPTGGQVLFEYAQDPPPPPLDPNQQKFRSVAASRGVFRDWLGRTMPASTASVSRASGARAAPPAPGPPSRSGRARRSRRAPPRPAQRRPSAARAR
jgi:hypothetical protein